MSKFVVGVSTLLVGLAVGYFLSGGKNNSTEEVSPAEDQPLYWVAPMDANYKRDKPGLSPMGMDLVPVYPEDLSGGGSPGTVSISPEVVNNLGVRTESVLFSPLQGIIKTVGYVSFDQEKMVDVHSRIAGWVESVSIYEEGEYVEKGQLLYEMYSPELVNAQEEYLVARKNGNRYLSQASEGKLQALGVPAVFIERLKKQRKAMDRVPVYAMHSGYVSQLNVRQGMYIKPTTKLLSLGSLDEVWVTADIFERQANLVSVGDQVEMTLDYLPGQNWLGNVDYIYPSLDDKTRSLQVRIRFDNPDLSLKPDMFARLALRTQATEPMLNVPSSSVIVTGSQTRVVVALGEGRYKSVEVKTGPRFADRTAILEGVLPEDWVVTSAQFLLDSESSISSDFLRMTPPSVGLIDEVWTQAQIREVNTDRRLVVLEHGAIREWKQSSMVMEVPASDTLDLSFLAEGSVIQVLLKGANMSELQLTDYILPRPKAPGSLPGADL